MPFHCAHLLAGDATKKLLLYSCSGQLVAVSKYVTYSLKGRLATRSEGEVLYLLLVY